MSLQVGEHRLWIISLCFSFMMIFFTESALAEVVHPLLRVGFCEAPGVYSEISVQLNFLQERPPSWRDEDFSVEVDCPGHWRSLRPSEEQQNIFDSPVLCP